MTNRQLLRLSLVFWVVLELIAAAQVRGPDGATILASWVRSILTPVVDATSGMIRATYDLRSGLADARRLAAENTRLSSRLSSLENRCAVLVADLEALVQTDRALQELPRFSGIPARCIYRDISRHLLQVVTNENRKSPIGRDTPVIGNGGVVGRVIRVEGTSCWVEVANHPAAAIAVTTADGSVHGLAEGTGGTDFSIQYISHDAQMSVGDPLFTSGADGIYPPGLPVAVVSRVRESDDPFLDIRARPFVDIPSVRAVWLLQYHTKPGRSKERTAP